MNKIRMIAANSTFLSASRAEIPLAGAASIRNSGASPAVGVIVSGDRSHAAYHTLGPVRGISPMPGAANVALWRTQG